MGDVKKGIGKTRLSLATSVVLVVVLVVSGAWLYSRVDNLQRQVDFLQDQVDNPLSGANIFQHMPDATLSQSNPTSETKYIVLNTTKNARILGIGVICTWTVQPTALKIRLTIDGQNSRAVKAYPANNTWYMIYWSEPYVNPDLSSSIQMYRRAFFVEGRSIKIEAEVTEGTVSELSARVKYAVIP